MANLVWTISLLGFTFTVGEHVCTQLHFSFPVNWLCWQTKRLYYTVKHFKIAKVKECEKDFITTPPCYIKSGELIFPCPFYYLILNKSFYMLFCARTRDPTISHYKNCSVKYLKNKTVLNGFKVKP